MIALLLKYWKQILFVILVLSVIVLTNIVYTINLDRNRLAENQEQMQKINSTLTLTTNEFKDLLKNSELKQAKHLDSLFKANKINPKGVLEVHNITNNYKDTSIVNIVVPDATVLIPKPISIGNKCWGFKGTISNQELQITERFYSITTDVVDYAKPKKFLWITWGWHKPELKGFTDCGDVTVVTYRHAKK